MKPLSRTDTPRVKGGGAHPKSAALKVPLAMPRVSVTLTIGALPLSYVTLGVPTGFEPASPISSAWRESNPHPVSPTHVRDHYTTGCLRLDGGIRTLALPRPRRADYHFPTSSWYSVRLGRVELPVSRIQNGRIAVFQQPVAAGCRDGHNRQSPVECLGIEPRSTDCKSVVLAVVTSTPFAATEGPCTPYTGLTAWSQEGSQVLTLSLGTSVHQEGFEPPTHSV